MLPTILTVSYTHLDVYKRQVLDGVAAGDVRLVALPPKGKLIPISRLGGGIGVEIGVIHSEISSFSNRRHTPSRCV